MKFQKQANSKTNGNSPFQGIFGLMRPRGKAGTRINNGKQPPCSTTKDEAFLNRQQKIQLFLRQQKKIEQDLITRGLSRKAEDQAKTEEHFRKVQFLRQQMEIEQELIFRELIRKAEEEEALANERLRIEEGRTKENEEISKATYSLMDDDAWMAMNKDFACDWKGEEDVKPVALVSPKHRREPTEYGDYTIWGI